MFGRKKSFWMIPLALLLVLLAAGCGQKDGNTGGMDHSSMDMGENDAMNPIKVEIMLPEALRVDETVKFKAKVTQADKPVDDAKEVLFEVWKTGSEDHEKVAGILGENGIYQMEKKFTEPGDYEIIAHVTARDMHSMPKKTFKVSE